MTPRPDGTVELMFSLGSGKKLRRRACSAVRKDPAVASVSVKSGAIICTLKKCIERSQRELVNRRLQARIQEAMTRPRSFGPRRHTGTKGCTRRPRALRQKKRR